MHRGYFFNYYLKIQISFVVFMNGNIFLNRFRNFKSIQQMIY